MTLSSGDPVVLIGEASETEETLALAGVHGQSHQVSIVVVEHIFWRTINLQLFLDDPVVGLQTFSN